MFSAFCLVGCPDWRWTERDTVTYHCKSLTEHWQPHAQGPETHRCTCCITATAFSCTRQHFKGGNWEAALCIQKVKTVFLPRHSHIQNTSSLTIHQLWQFYNYTDIICWGVMCRDVQVAVLSMHMPDFNNSISFLCNALNNHMIITNTQVLKILNLVFSFFHIVESTEEILKPRPEKIVWMKGQRLNMPPLKNNVLSNWFPQSVTEIKATNVRIA